jgi:hypothetical protein
MAVSNELMSIPSFGDAPEGIFATEEKMLEGFKKTLLMVAGSAVQKLMQTLSKEQEVLMSIADIAIDTYQAESVLLRVQKALLTKPEAELEAQIAIVKTYFFDLSDKIAKHAKDAIFMFAEGDERKMMLMGVKRFTKTNEINPKELRHVIAEKIIEANQYCY